MVAFRRVDDGAQVAGGLMGIGRAGDGADDADAVDPGGDDIRRPAAVDPGDGAARQAGTPAVSTAAISRRPDKPMGASGLTLLSVAKTPPTEA